MKISTLFAALTVVGMLQLTASAQYVPTAYFVDPALPGSTQFDKWTALTAGSNPGYPGFPGSGAWPGPIGSNAPGSGDAGLLKTANGTGGAPYPAGGSIYYGGFSGDINNNGGRLAVQDATPVANLANVVFQLDIGEAWTYDFYNDVLPTLSYNGGAQNIAPTANFLLEAVDNGTVTMPTGEETVYINTHLLQWDLSAIGDAITSFSVEFNGVQHAQLYGLQLDQSDEFVAYAPVPEPTTLSLAALTGVGMLAIRRRRRTVA